MLHQQLLKVATSSWKILWTILDVFSSSLVQYSNGKEHQGMVTMLLYRGQDMQEANDDSWRWSEFDDIFYLDYSWLTKLKRTCDNAKVKASISEHLICV